MEMSAEDVLNILIQECFYVNSDGELVWKFIEGVSLVEAANLSTGTLKPYMSEQQLTDLKEQQE
jgi:hypothetical protein